MNAVWTLESVYAASERSIQVPKRWGFATSEVERVVTRRSNEVLAVPEIVSLLCRVDERVGPRGD